MVLLLLLILLLFLPYKIFLFFFNGLTCPSYELPTLFFTAFADVYIAFVIVSRDLAVTAWFA